MSNTMLVYPMAAFVLLVAVIAATMLRRRAAAASAGLVKIRDFSVNQFSDSAPEAMLQAGNNYRNLFEMPVLFFAVCLAAMNLQLTDTAFVVLAWAYVALRAVHSYVHVTRNRVMTRLRVFALSALTLVAMWVWLVIRTTSIV